jgi:antitoxin YefM
MQATYRLFADEITDAFLAVIKDTYRNKEIEITVREAEDETAYLVKSEENRRHIMCGIKELQSDAPLQTMTIEQLAQFKP